MSALTTRTLLLAAALILVAAAAQAGGAFLGITMSPISSSMARALQIDEDEGVLVDEVVEDSPAAAAGIEAGDIIVAIAGNPITGMSGLSKEMSRHDPGDEVTVTVLRAGSRRDLDVTLGEKKHRTITVWNDDGKARVWSFVGEDGAEGEVFKDGNVFRWQNEDGEGEILLKGWGSGGDRGFLGIVPGDVEKGAGEDLGLRGDDGVVITELVEDGPAEEAGLREGDVIVAFDDEAIDDRKELHEFLTETEPGETITVRVVRDGRKKEYEVELAEAPTKVNLSDIFVHGGHSKPRFYSGTIAPDMDHEDMEREREELQEMRDELEAMRQELTKLREELEDKQ